MIYVCINDFFFQAEDGIRDFHVTGVQTCALPISGGSGVAEGKHAGTGLDEKAVGMAVVAAFEFDDLGPAGKAPGQADGGHGGFCAREIGRASCRERVERLVGGEELIKKEI